MSININSEASCRRAYINYHCYDNSMGITDKEMSEITDRWANKVQSWQNSASNDENEYEFDDSDYSSYNAGREEMEKASGNTSKGGEIARGVGDAVVGAGGVILSNVASNFGANVITHTANTVTSKVGAEAGKKVSNAVNNLMFMISATLSAATATMYLANKPNEEEVEACKEYINILGNAQSALYESQNEMADAADELEVLSDTANEVNEEGNEEIEENKTTQDFYLSSLNSLKAKKQSGANLTDYEQKFYNDLIKQVKGTGAVIQETSEGITDEVGEIYEEMGEYQEIYDYAAETTSEVLGMTDEAESLDKSTKTMCIVESVAQGLNAASGTQSAIQATKFALSGGIFTAWAWAFTALGAFGAVTSGLAVGQQISMSKEVQNEIDVRELTQELNTETSDMYTEEIDVYDGTMTGVEELEIAEPDEFQIPDESGGLVSNESKKPKEEEKEKKPEDKKE